MDELERIKKEKMKKLIEKRVGDEIAVVNVSDDNFEEKVIEESRTRFVVVDFWAPWCTPCLVLGPVLEKLTKEYDGKLIMAKANVDEARATAMKYEVRSIPSVKLFKDGKVVDEFIGAIPEPMVKQWIEKNID